MTRKTYLPVIALFLLGAVLGVLSKLLDIYTTNLGNIFSHLPASF